MISGFDYGTSNCAIGVINSTSKASQLLPLEGNSAFLPSTVYALGRELICERVASVLDTQSDYADYRTSRANTLQQAANFRREESIGHTEQTLFFGAQAFSQYFALPGEGYFVKSVKSFLGASGVQPEFIYFFEDIVTAMMMHIKQTAETYAASTLTDTVIGRPVNFQGVNTQKSNQQALDILTTSAQRAGFKQVEFQYEPIAAGLDFEKGLYANKKVLVVDIGGGTSDCAMVCMGPDHINNVDRYADFIGHAGERVGGNDFDIHLAARNIMPLFGMDSLLKNGLPMPAQHYWNAVTTNDVGAQNDFYSLQTTLQLEQLLRDSSHTQLMQRFMRMREQRQNQHVVKKAEEAKIQLSDKQTTEIDLDFVETHLTSSVAFSQLQAAAKRPLQKIITLMKETIAQAQVAPDMIYITGGSAKSPMIKQAIIQSIGNVTVVDGDHFGSVANGLTLWAEKIYA